MKWELTPLDEQETVINIDYCEKTINIYTNRKSVADRLRRKTGEPTKIFKNGEQIYAVEYVRNLYDKDLAKFFSKTLLIGAFKKQNDETEDIANN